uniref:(northern house mosquito) hypothetical protein n=1 Tax=Culex pipiens TaxID=7175 RepID=A0A8D8FCK6_CULPI
MKLSFIQYIWLLLALVVLLPQIQSEVVTFRFPEYDYKETSKNELAFREYESACDQSTRCSIFDGIDKTKCVRECVSPSCYHEIYKFDEVCRSLTNRAVDLESANHDMPVQLHGPAFC